jgi:hypothetical protein
MRASASACACVRASVNCCSIGAYDRAVRVFARLLLFIRVTRRCASDGTADLCIE